MTISQAEYEAAVPEACYVPAAEHMNYLGLCWGLLASMRQGIPHDCTGCSESKAVQAVYHEPHYALVLLKDGTEQRFGPFRNFGAAESAGIKKMFELGGKGSSAIHEKEAS